MNKLKFNDFSKIKDKKYLHKFFLKSTKPPHFPLRGKFGQLSKRKWVLYLSIYLYYKFILSRATSPLGQRWSLRTRGWWRCGRPTSSPASSRWLTPRRSSHVWTLNTNSLAIFTQLSWIFSSNISWLFYLLAPSCVISCVFRPLLVSSCICLRVLASSSTFMHFPASSSLFLNLLSCFAPSRIFLHLLASSCIFLHLLASSCIFLHLLAASCNLLRLLASDGIFLHASSSTFLHLFHSLASYFILLKILETYCILSCFVASDNIFLHLVDSYCSLFYLSRILSPLLAYFFTLIL